ncbi:nickel pincer cofactor biosynthesis protein LarC [Haloparvum sp. PAK95]|uniref:nickel pincer cofactor biosynthesis protein LarC n=1 Tax=Haloparvum sp. PAK95 TaxID=3418962 RepID=UPI003D2EAE1D
MQTLAFDGRTGAAGDMICAGLIAAGADPDVLAPVEDALPVAYEVGTTTKNGIRATTVDVVLDGGEGGASGVDGDDGEEHSHDHAGHNHSDSRHDHLHDDGHDHDGHEHEGHEHEHAEGAGVHRTYPEVVEVVESMPLPESVETNALAVFELLGEAEAAVHGTDLSETHFHEVGADDAIADVVGACLLLHDLDVDRVVTTPLATGGGEVEMSHGVYPVPTPAVVEVAERAGLTLHGGPVESELLTPTGAAILGGVAEQVTELPSLTVEASGYGAGRKSFPEHPNVIRVTRGESVDEGDEDAVEGGHDGHEHGEHEHGHGGHGHGHGGHEHGGGGDHGGHGHGHDTHADSGDGSLVRDDVAVLETNLDDAAPEVLGGLQETLKKAGAFDVTIVPTTMKKARPGHLVKVICKPGDAEAVAERLARETGTLGVREAGARHRWIAEREFETATLEIDGREFDVEVKIASTTEGEVYDVSAEYDDAASVAAETGLAIRDVIRRAENAVHE